MKRKHYLPCVLPLFVHSTKIITLSTNIPPPQGWQLCCYGVNCFDLLIGLQDISILIPDFYDIMELEENSETGSLNNGLDNPNQLLEDKKGKTSFCKIITITNQELL